MKKVHWFIVILIALFTAGSVSAQDLQATNQALELEINILKLQATKQALEAEMGQQNEPQPSEPIEDASGGMMNWEVKTPLLCPHRHLSTTFRFRSVSKTFRRWYDRLSRKVLLRPGINREQTE